MVLAPFNLSIIQYNALLLLDDSAGRRLTDLSERLLCDKSTITRTVDWLQNEGLAQRAADPDDRRAQRVILTDKGRTLLTQVAAAHEQSLAERLVVFSGEEQQLFVGMLARLRENLRAELERGVRA